MVTEISGAYTIGDRAAIEAWLSGAKLSAATVFVLPDANTGKFHVGAQYK